jgi:preprotein translocase subunit SecB
MTEESTPEVAAEPQEPQGQFQLQKIYMKDASFEIPNAPQVFQEDGQVEIKMNLAQRVENLADNVHEVVLTVTVTASFGEKTAYLAEVQQAGIFMISGMAEQVVHAALNTLCPHSLFPYARRVITDMVADGGFPPLVLQPINFDQIYAQRMQEAQAKQASEAEDMEVQGNA